MADRSVLDSYIYLSLDFKFSCKNEILNFLISTIKKNPYDLLVFVPKEFELLATEAKKRLNSEHRAKEDELANNLFLRFQNSDIAQKFIIIHGNIEERMKQISTALEDY